MRIKKRIWLVGRSGRLGSALENLLSMNQDYSVIGTNEAEVDITHLSEVENFFDQVKPDIIINCAAKGDKEWCEAFPEEAYALHAIGPRNLAIEANRHDTHLFCLSSDFVFDGGSTVPYTEFDLPQPQTMYGKTKLAGEEFVKTLCHRHTILRSSWLYGKKYLNELIEDAKTGAIHIHKDIIGSPTSSLELAETIIRFFDTNEYGTFHISCEGEATLTAFIQEILNILNIEADILMGDEPSRFERLRPRYSVLDNQMLRLTGQPPMKHWKEALLNFIKDRHIG